MQFQWANNNISSRVEHPQKECDVDSWSLEDIQPGLYGIYTSLKEALNKGTNVGFPNMFDERVPYSFMKAHRDTFEYNWELDTLYAYNSYYMDTYEPIHSNIWNSHSGLFNFYRKGSMGISQTTHIPDHHIAEFHKYLKEWNEKKFKMIFEMDSVEASVVVGTPHEPYVFSRIIIRNGKVIDLKCMKLRTLRWYVKEENVFYD